MIEKQLGPIGVMDSGVGGISVLRELVKLLPGEDFLYYGDSAHAPYGTKEVAEVVKLTERIAELLLEKGSKALVVACNTATSVAIPVLRKTYSHVPVIGIEPALKPAVLAKDHPRVLVMATPMTLEQEKFSNMMHFYENDANIVKVPCPGLVELIEDGILDGPELEAYLEARFAPFEPETADGIVLGCTHYPLIRPKIASLFPRATIYDGGYGTAKQTRRRLEECGLLSPKQSGGKVTFLNSKNDPRILALSRKLLEL
ncbi:MAG: glutamate racemase [Ruminococcaceae bacterium]|nr:glutamate racemase [Oscillospiraceae bacterium]